MSTQSQTDHDLILRLNRHPLLKARIEALLGVVENGGAEVEKADEAERRVIEELRQMGQEALRHWAQNRVVALSETPPQEEAKVLARSGQKKLYWHSTFGLIEVVEPARCAAALPAV